VRQISSRFIKKILMKQLVRSNISKLVASQCN